MPAQTPEISQASETMRTIRSWIATPLKPPTENRQGFYLAECVKARTYIATLLYEVATLTLLADSRHDRIVDLALENDALRVDAERWRSYQRSVTCQCCGAYKPLCVCWGGQFTGADGVTVSQSCSPKDHGRG